MTAIGTVYLVGAGPGDPELITVRGLRLLQSADVILTDRLVAPELLREVRADAQVIDVGKTPYQGQKRDQNAINALLIEHAHAGRSVVRLKGGDPFVFGRGGEEALACAAAGVPFVIVPGVSSAIAVPAYAGIPVTHRDMNAAFTVFAGHEDPGKGDSQIDYAALACAAHIGTLILLMGVANLRYIADRLIEAGLPADTPAACIERGTFADQRVVEGRLDNLPDLVRTAGIRAPATTVIGQVVTLRGQGLRWFNETHKSER